MVINTVFSGNGTCHIMLCDVAKYFPQGNIFGVGNNCSPGSSINKNIQRITNNFEKLLNYQKRDRGTITTEFDSILRYLYDSKHNDSSYNYNLLLQNIIKLLTMLKDDLDNYLSLDIFTPHVLFAELDYELKRILLDQSLIENDTVASILFQLSIYLEEFIAKIQRDDIENEFEIVKAFGNLYDNVGKDLETYLADYSFGNLDKLKEEFTLTIYERLATALLAEKNEDLVEYEKIRQIFNSSLEGLQRSLLLQKEYEGEILTLNKTIDNLRSGDIIRVIDTSISADVIAQIKREYKTYIEIYGFPINGVFDAEKLAYILANMN